MERGKRKDVAKLKDEHVENLRALEKAPEGLLRGRMPHSRYVQLLVNKGLVDVCGVDWISHVRITDEGRSALKELEE